MGEVMTLGEKIRSRRLELGLTQAQLGKRVGWQDSRIGAYERNTVVPRKEALRKLAEALELSPDEFGLYEDSRWFAVTRWCADDVIAAAEQNGVTLTPEHAERWLEKNEGWFSDMLAEYGNEVLASASRESFEEACKL